MSLKRNRYHSSPAALIGIPNSRFERASAHVPAWQGFSFTTNNVAAPVIDRYEDYYRDLVGDKVFNDV